MYTLHNHDHDLHNHACKVSFPFALLCWFTSILELICIIDETVEARDFVFLEGCLTVWDYCRYLISYSIQKI